VTAPTPRQLDLLTTPERLSFAWCDLVNRTPLLKRLSHEFLRRVGTGWVHPCTKHLLVVDGIEAVRDLRPPGGTLLVANHRSFFDMYVLSMLLFRHTALMERICFPVRSEFFYDSLGGVVVNGLMSAFSMYPPVLRQPERSDFNGFTTARLVELLRAPGTLVGFHPEGTRNKTADPYTLLPAYPGVGQLIHHARPTVLPAFVLGLTNDFVRQVRSNFDGTGRKIIVTFGAPLDLERFYAMPARLRTYMELAKHVRRVLMELGQRERALRAAIEGDPAPAAAAAAVT
jgi:1-acyl-sn-glycerol-3-phosphate acyltransferase